MTSLCSWWSKRRPALPQVYLPIGWSTYFFSAARVTFNTSEVDRAKAQVDIQIQIQHSVCLFRCLSVTRSRPSPRWAAAAPRCSLRLLQWSGPQPSLLHGRHRATLLTSERIAVQRLNSLLPHFSWLQAEEMPWQMDSSRCVSRGAVFSRGLPPLFKL